jgi:hypothetical protein
MLDLDSTPVDQLGGFVITADVLHHVGHLKKLYEFQTEIVSAAFDVNVVHDVYVKTGSKELHMVWEAAAYGGRVEVVPYRNPAVTAATGTAVTPFNKFGGATNDLETTVLLNPTVTAAGTQCYSTRQIFGSTSGQARNGSSLRGGTEIVLLENSGYLFRCTSKTNDTLFQFFAEIYERFSLAKQLA